MHKKLSFKQNDDLHSRLKQEHSSYKTKLRKGVPKAKRLHYLRLFT